MNNGWIINYSTWSACYFHSESENSLCGYSTRNHGFVNRITELDEAKVDLCSICKDELAKHLKNRNSLSAVAVA
jgi:hypothetical protein